MKLKRVALILIYCLLPSIAYSWNDSITHKDISEYAAENSVLVTSDYLKQIGITDGLMQPFQYNAKEQELYKWIREGAELEDVFPRWMNHFHNPLKPWSEAGLWENNTFWKSSVLWAQNGAFQGVGDWSWQKNRSHFYSALTSPIKADREAYFAQLFRGLGHQMHLVQDMAVPYHVRNNAHPLDKISKGFETWVANKKSNLTALKEFIPAIDLVFPNVSYNISYDNFAPITQLSDTTQYGEINPTNSTMIGLAEYTNANFFSEDTIFMEDTILTPAFPYPNKTSTNLQEYLNQKLLPETIISEDGVPDISFWIKKTKDGELITHFAKPGYFTNEVYYPGVTKVYDLSFILDDACHQDYAQKLLPRAVGYSAALLDYFFRGQINLLSIGDANQYVIANDSNEELNGAFTVHYDSKTDGQRHQLTSLTGSVPAHGQSTALRIDPQPDAQYPHKYMLVFRGVMGNEADAVAGREVNLCPKTGPVAITGPEEPVNGDQYTATGGAGPYTWTINKGTITQDGIIAASTQCGTGTIIATDSCGNEGTKVVRMPGGEWVKINDKWATITSSYPNGACTMCGMSYGSICSVSDGAIKVYYGVESTISSETGGFATCVSNLEPPPCMLTTPYGCEVFTLWKTTYEWRCQ